MAQKNQKGQRGRLGYGSSYRKGSRRDMTSGKEIGTVLGGQVWMVTPDRQATTDDTLSLDDGRGGQVQKLQQFLRLHNV